MPSPRPKTFTDTMHTGRLSWGRHAEPATTDTVEKEWGAFRLHHNSQYGGKIIHPDDVLFPGPKPDYAPTQEQVNILWPQAKATEAGFQAFMAAKYGVSAPIKPGDLWPL